MTTNNAKHQHACGCGTCVYTAYHKERAKNNNASMRRENNLRQITLSPRRVDRWSCGQHRYDRQTGHLTRMGLQCLYPLFALTKERETEKDRETESGLERLYWHKSVASHRVAIGATGKKKRKRMCSTKTVEERQSVWNICVYMGTSCGKKGQTCSPNGSRRRKQRQTTDCTCAEEEEKQAGEYMHTHGDTAAVIERGHTRNDLREKQNDYHSHNNNDDDDDVADNDDDDEQQDEQ